MKLTPPPPRAQLAEQELYYTLLDTKHAKGAKLFMHILYLKECEPNNYRWLEEADETGIHV